MIPRDGYGDLTNADESTLIVHRTLDLQTMLLTFCGYRSGVMPFCVRANGRFIPAGARYEREYVMEGNDEYHFEWHKDGQPRTAALRLFDEGTCEVLAPPPT